jgi:hypothetical protein
MDCFSCGRRFASNRMCSHCRQEYEGLKKRLAVAIELIRDLRNCCQDWDEVYGIEWSRAQRIVEGLDMESGLRPELNQLVKK